MKRRLLLKLVLFLLLGAIVNIAVAWGLFAWHPGDVRHGKLSQADSDEVWHRWQAPFPRSYRAASIEDVQFNSFYYAAHAKDTEGVGIFEIMELGAGWPCSCVVGQLWDNGMRTVPAGSFCRHIQSGPASRSTRCSMLSCCGCCWPRRSRCGGGDASSAACARSAPTTCAAAAAVVAPALSAVRPSPVLH